MTRPCPVCDEGRTDARAIYLHNLRCAETGERSYPEPVYAPTPRRR